jgi:hypothetical protein
MPDKKKKVKEANKVKKAPHRAIEVPMDEKLLQSKLKKNENSSNMKIKKKGY